MTYILFYLKSRRLIQYKGDNYNKLYIMKMVFDTNLNLYVIFRIKNKTKPKVLKIKKNHDI